MEITVNIKAPELASALENLAAALIGTGAVQVAATNNAPSISTDTPVTAPSAPAAPQTGSAANEPQQPSEDVAKPESEDSGHIPTVVDLRAKAQEKGTTKEAKKAIKELLNEFDSKSISDVPEDKRAAFLASLEDL